MGSCFGKIYSKLLEPKEHKKLIAENHEKIFSKYYAKKEADLKTNDEGAIEDNATIDEGQALKQATNDEG